MNKMKKTYSFDHYVRLSLLIVSSTAYVAILIACMVA